MAERDAIEVASRLISQSQLNPCQFESVRRNPRSSIASPTTIGDEWVVLFAFHEDDVVRGIVVKIGALLRHFVADKA